MLKFAMVGLLLATSVVAQQARLRLDVREDSKLGAFLTGADGKTLYIFTRDSLGTSNCYDACAENWPPVLASQLPTLPGGAQGRLTLIERKDKTRQVAYNGQPLYYWKRDRKAGDTLGQALNDVWYVAKVGRTAPTATSVEQSGNPSAASGPTAAQSAVKYPPGDSMWVTNAPKNRAAVLTVKAGSPTINDGFNYNGVTDGEKGFVVPQGWRVVINFRNMGDTFHTAIVVDAPKSGELKDQYPVTAAAFPGAGKRVLVHGQGTGEFDATLDFVANKPGVYLILCGRLNHALNGQYVRLVVDPNASVAEWKSFKN
ncbi:sulfocyanin-like copper-binding protein [Deinococcus yavapaiensis]|uniref:Secreted repeat protein with Y-X4-D motif n=1 Tax=Deinococcus yavapaiensis KR-236 TaxID=694435 RepID=A0A318SJC4_9DEIO|nr:sulfocyanin-like copper-binding protein [Deinococcus yavapaiensis]PYE54386.1 secreted repeat protein with Y-X4-D motif [Deinococcus yavapaiensis KR-236]